MQVVNVILDLLEDGKWHSLTELASRAGLHEFKLELITSFLAEYNFVELNKDNKKIRLNVSVTDFLRKIKHIESDVSKENG